MRALRRAMVAALLLVGVPVAASTYFPVKKSCPVGGKSFQYMALGSISRWGALPDGQPLGSGIFPVAMPQCPDNGLVLYRDFTPEEVKKLKPFIEGEDYKALRAAGETPYYLAYRTARLLGDEDQVWILLQASWEVKGQDASSERARRYNQEFVTAVMALPVDPASFDSIALRARAANALRELGRFEEAEALRTAVVIAPDAGGTDQNAVNNRKGWADYLQSLADPIARKDMSRAPIDMIGEREAVFRCTEKEAAKTYGMADPAPLSPFEQAYCARADIAPRIAERLKEMTR